MNRWGVMAALVASALVLLAATVSEWTDRAPGTDLSFYDNANQETVRAMSAAWLSDDFFGKAIDTTNDWNLDSVNSGTAAINAAVGGTARLTTGAADDDDVELATSLNWQAGKWCSMEARLAPNDIAHTAWVVGFSDAVAEGADTLAVTYNTSALTSTASDCAVFFQDADKAANIYCTSVKANTDKTITDTGIDAVNATYHVYRVEIDPDGDIDFWLDGAHVGTQTLGITTTTSLCGYVGLINRESAANTLDVDYVRCWQRR